MVEVLLEGLAAHVEEATILNWFFEEGDAVNEGDDLVELQTEEGNITIQAAGTGLLAEVYYDEGEVVARGEVLCTIDDEESEIEDLSAENDG
jgi:pyruvate/2-oxoglutarate dehydrogenase complex dihydrolipoamide acyltransferase (E2) component